MQNLKSLFTQRSNHAPSEFSVVDFVSGQHKVANAVGSLANHAVVSVESFGELSQEDASTVGDLYSTLERELVSLGFESYNQARGTDAARVQGNMIAAAAMGLIGYADEVKYKRQLLALRNPSARAGETLVTPQMSGPFGTVPTLTTEVGLENYNEKSQRDFRVITAGYNLESARQDLFGETLYPTTVVNAAEGGIVQVLPYVAIMKDVYHKVTGQRYDTQEVNLVDAYRDPSVLDDVSTTLYPVVDPDGANEDVFIDASLVKPISIITEHGETLETAPLRIGAKFDLIGISNRNQLLAGNIMDITDTIDPAARLKAVYVAFQGKVVRFLVERMPTAVFQPKLIGDTRTASLDFETEDLTLNGDTVAVDQSRPGVSDELQTRGWNFKLAMKVSGSVSLSKGNTWITAAPVEIDRIYDVASGERLDPTKGEVATLIGAIGKMEVVGYELDARFTNTNRRQRGHLLQTRALQFRYPIPMHAPVTLLMSTMDEQGPGEVVKALTVVTNVRNSANAVTRMLNYVAQLKEVVGAGYDRPKFGAVEGALSAMMRPVYRYAKLDLREAVDTIRSGDRWNDVCSAILNTARSLLFPAYRDSNIQAVFQTITGNIDERPKFIFATDMEIANYLMTSGDNRTLGAYLKYDIVATNNERFDGKLIIIPTRENPVENDILNWGQFYYVSTIVADLPIARNGQISREIAAVPFNLHVNNIPFAIEIDITGLHEVMTQSLYNSAIRDNA